MKKFTKFFNVALAALVLLAQSSSFALDKEVFYLGSSSSHAYLTTGVDGDTVERFSLGNDGLLEWGAGSASALDTNLYRSAASTLKTDDSLVVGATLTPTALIMPTETVTATNVIATSECGTTYFLNSATEFASTLPAPTAGCSFKFVIKAAPSGADYTIGTASGADILIGGVNELEVDTADDGPYDDNADVISFKGGVAVVGDYIEMISDGTSWYFKGQTNADGGVTTGTT